MPCDMTSYQALAGKTLTLIGDPPALATRMGDVYEALLMALEHYGNVLDLSGGNFILGKKEFTLPAATIAFELMGVSDWGKPLIVETDPAAWNLAYRYIRHEVDVVDLQDLDRFRDAAPRWIWPETQLAGSVIASAVAWYWSTDETSKLMLEFEFGSVKPQTSVPYRVYYQPAGALASFDETKTPQWLANFQALITFHAASILLPKSGYDDTIYARYLRMIEQHLATREQTLLAWINNDHTKQSGSFAGWRRGQAGGRRGRR
jgi:hypothetical protein